LLYLLNTLETKTQLHINCVLSIGYDNHIKYDPYTHFVDMLLLNCPTFGTT